MYERYAHPEAKDQEFSDQQAAYWYDHAHRQGIAEGSFSLGTLFGQKRGLNTYDFEDINFEILELYRAAVLKGLSAASRSLALSYVEYYTPKLFSTRAAAIDEAVTLLTAMAKEGNRRVLTDLGLIPTASMFDRYVPIFSCRLM